MNTHKYLSSLLLCWLMWSGLLFSSNAAAVRRRMMFGCTVLERDALLAYKFGIFDPSNRLSSWNINQDCCRWSGVVCHNKTMDAQVHVVQLNLQNPYADNSSSFQYFGLEGDLLSSSLLSLTHLEGVNLAWNNFNSSIPDLVGSFQKLRYLDLGMSNFLGNIPPQLGNLSRLRYLDLHSNQDVTPYAHDLDWLSKLSYLTYLDMSQVNLTAISKNWLSVINTLSSLQELHLKNCYLNYIPPFVSHLNLTTLNILSLGANYFKSTLPNWLWNITTLSVLDLRHQQFHGTIPIGISNLASLTYLNLHKNSLIGPLPTELWGLPHLDTLSLAYNSIRGHIPSEIGNLSSLSTLLLDNCALFGPIPGEMGNLTSLEILSLENNSLSGSVPADMGKLYNLQIIELSHNSLQGVLSQLHFPNSTKLHVLSLHGNYLLDVAFDQTWVPPFQLKAISLHSCKVGPSFPRWIHSQQMVEFLSLANASIEDALPDWFWNLSSSSLFIVDLSQNKITGVVPSSLERLISLKYLNLQGNLLNGSVPQLPPNMYEVDISNNLLSGPLIPLNFPNALFLSNNHIIGSIPPSLCLCDQIIIIDLSNNEISGQIPRCNWEKATNLGFIHLGNNKLTGKIPSSLGSLPGIIFLHLNNNNLHGCIPSSLQSYNRLLAIDLGENKFSGQIPVWIGQSWKELTILRLHSNKFYGNIPPQLGQLGKLQVIDLSSNHLAGPIPHSFGNLSAMIGNLGAYNLSVMIGNLGAYNLGATVSMPTIMSSIVKINISFDNTIGTVALSIKGREFSISKNLALFRNIDLSDNKLSGEIPQELGYLEGLQTLNLSRNYFTSKIPNTIGGLKSLETLDLSFNSLSGAIPQDLAMLSSLNHLNLSYNNLSGIIPTGNQLQTLDDESIYIGNLYLCGAPTNKSCFAIPNSDVMDEVDSNVLLNYLPAMLGFLVGLWSVFVVILVKKNLRYFYFRMIDNIYDKAYVAIKIAMKRRVT